jgi:hypothetical protein
MNGRFQMQGGKNWFLPKEMNANRFFCDSHWLEIWSNHFYPSMGPNGVSVAMDSVQHPPSPLVPLLADTAVKVASWPKYGPHSLTGCPNTNTHEFF